MGSFLKARGIQNYLVIRNSGSLIKADVPIRLKYHGDISRDKINTLVLKWTLSKTLSLALFLSVFLFFSFFFFFHFPPSRFLWSHFYQLNFSSFGIIFNNSIFLNLLFPLFVCTLFSFLWNSFCLDTFFNISNN